jgi:hypothetical protein
MASRPACPPGYVRLIDLDPGFVFMSAAIFVFSSILAILAVRQRRRLRRARWIAVAGIAVLLLSLGGSLLAIEMIRVNEASSTGSCWTF